MKNLIKYSTLSIFFLAFSNGQILAMDPQECASKVNAEERLACYDAALKQAKTAPEKPKNKGKWNVSFDTSKLTDKKNVYLSLEAEEYIKGLFNTNKTMSLYIVCRENSTKLYFHFGGNIMSEYNGGNIITYRLDKTKAASKSFTPSSDGTALGLWSGGTSIPFTKKLMNSNKIYIVANSIGGSQIDGDFDVRGLKTAIAPLRKECKW